MRLLLLVLALLGTACSAAGAQENGRPDLVVVDAAIGYDADRPSPCVRPASDRYGLTVRVRNQGGAAAGPFDVSAASGSLSERERVPGLAAGRTVAVPFSSPALTGGGAMTFVADAGGEVDESDEGNNEVVLFMPVPSQPPICTPSPPRVYLPDAPRDVELNSAGG